MPWASTAISVGGSLLGGIMGKSKAPERAAKDAAARAQGAQEQARRMQLEALSPYQEAGRGATTRLSELLGIAEPKGYAPRPTLQGFEDQLRDEHFKRYNNDGGRFTNYAGRSVQAKKMYDESLQKWEAGKSQYQAQNPESKGDGSLLKDFTNDDFVKDPGYTFRMMEGEQGINRGQLARGGFDSGAALKELNRFNQDYASNEFGLAYNRDASNKQRTFNMLSGTVGQGLQASGMSNNANQNAANNNSQTQNNLGNTLGAYAQNRNDNQNNLIQSTIGNLVYGYERNKANTQARTPDFNPYGQSTTRARDMFL